MITTVFLAVVFACGSPGPEVLAPVWTKFVGTKQQEYGRRLSVDTRGVLLAGMTPGDLGGPGQGSSDAFIARLSLDGDIQWIAQEGQVRIDNAWGAASGFGRNYLCGYSQLPNQPGQTMLVAQYDDRGNRCWRKYLGQGAIRSAVTDRFGNVVVTGTIDHTKLSVAKLNRCGRILWRVDDGGHVSYDVAVDRFGNVFITGWGRNAFVAKYDCCGRKCWRKELEFDGVPPTHSGFGVATDSHGNAYVCGWIGIQAEEGSFLVKLNRQGVITQTLIHREPGHRFNDIAVQNDRVVVGGDTGSNYAGRLFLLTANDSLETYTQHYLHERQDGKGEVWGVEFDRSGDIYASGMFSGRLNGQSTHIGYDAFVVKYRLMK